MKKYLKETEIVDFSNKYVFAKAQELASGCCSDIEIAKSCFEFARDEINHSGDYPSDTLTTLKASDVLKHKTGWCYSKAILENPHIPHNKLSGFGSVYKIKLRQSGYRLAYEVNDDKVIVLVLKIGKRDKIYEKLR